MSIQRFTAAAASLAALAGVLTFSAGCGPKEEPAASPAAAAPAAAVAPPPRVLPPGAGANRPDMAGPGPAMGQPGPPR